MRGEDPPAQAAGERRAAAVQDGGEAERRLGGLGLARGRGGGWLAGAGAGWLAGAGADSPVGAGADWLIGACGESLAGVWAPAGAISAKSATKAARIRHLGLNPPRIAETGAVVGWRSRVPGGS